MKNQLTPERISQLDALGFSWDPFSEQWKKAFITLESFSRREGHFRVPRQHNENGVALGHWILTQRKNAEKLSSEQVELLDSIGFPWDPFTDKWELGFSHLLAFRNREGHCRVPKQHKEGAYNLDAWARGQRQRKNKLTKDRFDRLESIDFCWDLRTDQWEEAFLLLQEFHKDNGHCRVPLNFIFKDFKLGVWTNSQRQKADQLSPDKIKRLDSLGFSWDPFLEQWNEAFMELQKFKKKEGHCRVPINFTRNGVNLGTWSMTQRQNKMKLSPERIKRLNSLGFSWNPFNEQWEAAISVLLEFRNREGHCRVPRNHREGGVMLGIWVKGQRDNRDKLTPEQIRRLDALGFSWDPFTERWEEAFSALVIYHKSEGHCRVPRHYTQGGFRLGLWVSAQRVKKSGLKPEQIKRLDSVGFIWSTGK